MAGKIRGNNIFAILLDKLSVKIILQKLSRKYRRIHVAELMSTYNEKMDEETAQWLKFKGPVLELETASIQPCVYL
jgi:hypothetical protein